MCSGTEGQFARADSAACLSTAATVSADSAVGLSVVQAVEHRPCRGECGRVRVELVEVDVQVLDRLLGQWHDAGLVPLAGEPDVPGLGQAEVLQCQAGDLTDAGGGVVEQDQQHPVPARFRRLRR